MQVRLVMADIIKNNQIAPASGMYINGVILSIIDHLNNANRIIANDAIIDMIKCHFIPEINFNSICGYLFKVHYRHIALKPQH